MHPKAAIPRDSRDLSYNSGSLSYNSSGLSYNSGGLLMLPFE